MAEKENTQASKQAKQNSKADQKSKARSTQHGLFVFGSFCLYTATALQSMLSLHTLPRPFPDGAKIVVKAPQIYGGAKENVYTQSLPLKK